MNFSPIVALPLVFALGAAASADTVVLNPSRDATLYDIPETVAANGSGEYLFVGHTNFAGERRALLRFDVSSIPPGSTITSARLFITVDRSRGSANEAFLHRVTADWGEGASDAGFPGGSGTEPQTNDATWGDRFFGQNLPWTNPGGDFVASPSGSTQLALTGDFEFTGAQMAADVQAWVDGASNFGWIALSPPIPEGFGAYRFGSRESVDETVRPALIVEFTPPAGGCPPCAADFNQDDGVDDLDIAAFFGAFESGEPCADVNGDEGIDDLDISFFFISFEAGC